MAGTVRRRTGTQRRRRLRGPRRPGDPGDPARARRGRRPRPRRSRRARGAGGRSRRRRLLPRGVRDRRRPRSRHAPDHLDRRRPRRCPDRPTPAPGGRIRRARRRRPPRRTSPRPGGGDPGGARARRPRDTGRPRCRALEARDGSAAPALHRRHLLRRLPAARPVRRHKRRPGASCLARRTGPRRRRAAHRARARRRPARRDLGQFAPPALAHPERTGARTARAAPADAAPARAVPAHADPARAACRRSKRRLPVADTLGAGDVLHGAYAWARARSRRNDTAPSRVDDAVFHRCLGVATTVASSSCAHRGTRSWLADLEAEREVLLARLPEAPPGRTDPSHRPEEPCA